MGIGNILVLSQVTAYVLAAILSLFIFPPVAVNKTHNFNGNCLLSAKGHYSDEDARFEVTSWGSTSPCNFAIFIGIVVMLYSIYQIVRLSFHLYNDTDGNFLSTFLSALFNIAFTVSLFASAITVTQGYQQWCRQLEEHIPKVLCSDAPYITRIWVGLPVDPAGFPAQWGVAQFGLWGSFIVWVCLCTFSFFKLFKLHQQENIMRSLSRERQRLLHEDSGPTVY